MARSLEAKRGVRKKRRRASSPESSAEEDLATCRRIFQQLKADKKLEHDASTWKQLKALEVRLSKIESGPVVGDEPGEAVATSENHHDFADRLDEVEDILGLRYPFRIKLRHTSLAEWICIAKNCDKVYTRMDHMRKHISHSFDLAHSLLAELLSQTECRRCNMEFDTPQKLVHHRGRHHEEALKGLQLEGALAIYGD